MWDSPMIECKPSPPPARCQVLPLSPSYFFLHFTLNQNSLSWLLLSVAKNPSEETGIVRSTTLCADPCGCSTHVAFSLSDDFYSKLRSVIAKGASHEAGGAFSERILAVLGCLCRRHSVLRQSRSSAWRILWVKRVRHMESGCRTWAGTGGM